MCSTEVKILLLISASSQLMLPLESCLCESVNGLCNIYVVCPNGWYLYERQVCVCVWGGGGWVFSLDVLWSMDSLNLQWVKNMGYFAVYCNNTFRNRMKSSVHSKIPRWPAIWYPVTQRYCTGTYTEVVHVVLLLWSSSTVFWSTQGATTAE